MLKAPNALYPFWSNTPSSSDDNASSPLRGAQQYLGAAEAVVYTFSRKPPLVEGGFWSLTAYEDNYLIPNGRDVYALGDRSNLTYADGKHVYGFSGGGDGQGDGERDGEFQILVQPADVMPPANWTRNWLPARKFQTCR